MSHTHRSSLFVRALLALALLLAPMLGLEEYAGTIPGFKNLGNGDYQYNWQTQKSWAGRCRTLKLDLGAGQVVTALFQFR